MHSSRSLSVIARRVFIGIIAGRMVPNIWALPCPFSTFNDSRPYTSLAGCQANFTVPSRWINSKTFVPDIDSTIHGSNPTKFGASIGSATSLALSSPLVDTSNPSFMALNEASDGSIDPNVSEAIIPFLLVATFVFACYFVGPSLYHRLLEKLGQETSTGLGFGFDGLTKAQLKAVRLKEEMDGNDGDWFIKLPEKPPALILKRVAPLTPIQLLAEHDDYDWKAEEWSKIW